jgi:hypothetical protein
MTRRTLDPSRQLFDVKDSDLCDIGGMDDQPQAA